MTSIQPELWVERAGQAVAFYADAFGARVLHQAGQGDDIVAQLAVGRRRSGSQRPGRTADDSAQAR